MSRDYSGFALASAATSPTARPKRRRYGYTCPVCGGWSRTKHEHNADGDCSKLIAENPHRDNIPVQKAWKGEDTTTGDWKYQQEIKER